MKHHTLFDVKSSIFRYWEKHYYLELFSFWLKPDFMGQLKDLTTKNQHKCDFFSVFTFDTFRQSLLVALL